MKTRYSSEINNWHSQEGLGLVSVIIIITALTSLISIMAMYSWVNSHRNVLEISNSKTFYLSESGLQYALHRSIIRNNWSWSENSNFADGKVLLTVTPQDGNEIIIKSRSEMSNTAKCNSLRVNVINLLDYTVYISGEIKTVIGYDSSDKIHFDASSLPNMNLDSLKEIAQRQGNYSDKDIRIDNHSDETGFWTNPYNHRQDATIIYTEKNLTIDKSNKEIGAIFVVIGDVILKDSKKINGVIYMANSSSKSHLNCYGKKSIHTVRGAIIGNTDIISSNVHGRPELNVYQNPAYIEKFYSYSINGPKIVKKVSWTSNY